MNEENEVIMAILRGIYERRQLQHTHIGQVTHNPHFFYYWGFNLDVHKAKIVSL